MLNSKNIKETYETYKKECLGNEIMPKNLLILSKCKNGVIAQINYVCSDFAEILINEQIFYYSNIDTEYLIQILYHEFTHIHDKLSYFSSEKDEKKHRKLLFPYTEYHAAQIEMYKRLELFDNPKRQITLKSSVHHINGIITVEDFIEYEKNEFSHCIQIAKDCSNIENIQSILYLLIYNLGFYSILRRYNIDNRLKFDNDFSFIEHDMILLAILLINQNPSENLCKKSSNIALRIAKNIADNLGLSLK